MTGITLFLKKIPSWKIYPLRYESLYKKKNYSDYDYIVTTIYQDEDIITKTLNVNYFISGSRVKFPYLDKNEPVTFYLDTKDGALFIQRFLKILFIREILLILMALKKNIIVKETI